MFDRALNTPLICHNIFCPHILTPWTKDVSFTGKITTSITQNKSSHRRCYLKKVFLEVSQNSQQKTCARNSFLIKLQATCNFIKKETLALKFLKTPFLQNISGQLLVLQ